jgi:uncharacterized protein (UPF0371 family)
VATGLEDPEALRRVEVLMEEFGIRPEDRPVVTHARKSASDAVQRTDKGHRGVYCGAAVQLGENGELVRGLNSPLMHAASALVLNAVKSLAGIPEKLELLSPATIESIANLKKDILERGSISLNLNETLIALSISSTSNPTAALAMEQLKKLKGCEVHLTHLPTPGDEKGLRRLGVNLTCDPEFATNKLFVS